MRLAKLFIIHGQQNMLQALLGETHKTGVPSRRLIMPPVYISGDQNVFLRI